MNHPDDYDAPALIMQRSNEVCSNSSISSSGKRHFVYSIYTDGLWYGMLVVALIVLTLYALLTGLILAVCGPEMTWLRLRSVTGTPKERKRARVVTRLQRHSSWMLCSLILCTVICAEGLPFIIQGLWNHTGQSQWVPVLASTIMVALCAEIIPQYFIPRNPVEWAYFCWPFIYMCMFLTAIVSWPLAWLLDKFGGKKNGNGIFTHGEMASLIKYHECSEKNGGMIGSDAARVMTGALRLDSRPIGGDICTIPGEQRCKDEKDLEKANMVIVRGMIRKWLSVKTVDIDEVINSAFITKVKQWSYSRIPVIGAASTVEDVFSTDSTWQGKQIFGYVHIKSLIGMRTNSSSPIRVRDLHIYAVPVVQEDTPAYEVLNLFRLGLSEMAIVVPKPLNNGLPLLTLSPNNFDIINRFQTPCWAPLEPETSNLASSMDKSDEQGDWAAGVLGNKSTKNQNSRSHGHNIVGIKSPKPVGIVTLEDIISAILQKPAHADVDFSYGPENGIPKSDVPDIGATIVGKENFSHTPSSGPGFDTIPPYIRKEDKPKGRSVSGGLRKRIVSSKEKALPTLDGAEDESTRLQSDTVRGCSSETNPFGFNEAASSRATFTNNPYLSLDGVADDRSTGRFDVHQDVISHTARNGTDHSSYTQNSRGGFHGVLPSEATLHNASGLAPESLKSQILAEMGGNSSIDDSQSSQGRVEPDMKDSIPLQKPPAQVKSAMVTAPWAKRYVSAEAPVILPFKRETFSSFDRIEQSFRHKLNPGAPTFLVTSPSGHDHSAADVDTIYAGYSIRTASGAWHGGGRNGNASIRSSCHENNSRLVNSIIVSESSGLFDAHVAVESPWPSDVLTYSEKYNGQNPHLFQDQAYEYESCSGDYSEIPDFPAPPDTFGGDPNSHLFDGPVLTPEPYDAIPLELLENMANKENRNQIQMSKTLPRMRGKKSGSSTRSTLMRESSFHDDRALLPSQRRAAERSASSTDPVMGGEVRRSSIWF